MCLLLDLVWGEHSFCCQESAGLSFRDIAAAAAQQWRDLDEHAREVFREQQAALAGQKKKIKAPLSAA